MEVQKKKRGRKPKNADGTSPAPVKIEYFGQVQEEALKLYLAKEISERQRNELFQTVLEPCFRELIAGVLQMPMFQKMVIIGTSEEQLKEDAYYHLVFQLEKFDPNRIGKTGKPVKAYSYLGTVVKNHFLGLKIVNDGLIAKHGGMLDVDELSDHIQDTGRDPAEFEDLKKNIVDQLEKALLAKRLNKNDLIVGHTLKYMLSNWHKIEFQTKNEFIRQLCHYTQLNPPVVARSLKKFKSLVYDFLMQPTSTKTKKTKARTKTSKVTRFSNAVSYAYEITDLETAKRFMIKYLETTTIEVEEKQILISNIRSINNLTSFQEYISNCLLEYEDLGSEE